MTPQAGNEEDMVNQKELKRYQTAVGKLLYLAKWKRPDIVNPVRELSRFVTRAQRMHVEIEKRVMRYCLNTRTRGLTIKPKEDWNGIVRQGIFKIEGYSDSDYDKDIES